LQNTELLATAVLAYSIDRVLITTMNPAKTAKLTNSYGLKKPHVRSATCTEGSTCYTPTLP